MLSTEGLVNREFQWGRYDCYAMLRDFYKLNFDIELSDFARPTGWYSGALELILHNSHLDGWEKISTWSRKDLRPGDVLAIAILESEPNHLGIYLGDNTFAHHMMNSLSSVVPLGSHWLHSTCYLLRHPDVPDLTVKKPDVNIEELLRARHQTKAL